MARFCTTFLVAASLICSLAAAARPLYACTGFVVANDKVVLAGNNEDYWNTNTRMWFEPASNGKHGRVYFGFDNGFPQGGMNTQGLFFDGFATSSNKVKKTSNRPRFKGTLIDEAMATCATVEEVVKLFSRYNLEFLEKAMLFYADRTGDAVIIEGDVFLRKKDSFQIITNIYQSRVRSAQMPCERYRIAHEMLAGADQYDIDLCRRVLAATHAEGTAVTLYSNVYDLKNRIVYLYHFHNFENVVVVDLEQELKKGKHQVDIASLFPKTFAAELFRRAKEKELKQKIKKRVLSSGVDVKVLDEYVGRYKFPPGIVSVTEFQVTRSAKTLYGGVEGREKFEMFPESESRFFRVSGDGAMTFSFERDNAGKVARLVCERNGTKFVGFRAK